MNPSILVPMRRASLVVVALAVFTTALPFGFQGQPPVPPQGGRGGRGGEPPASSGTGVIVGTVVDGTSGRPMPGAIVTLGGRFPQQPSPVVVGSDGRFVFRDLPAGLFSLPVTRNGYLDSSAGRTSPTGMARPVELRDGDRIGDVVLRLWRHAVVSGNAVDERGEPVVGLRVALLQRTVVTGQWSLEEQQDTRTDDRGWYRFTRVAPGRYVIAGRQDPEGFMEAAVMAMSADLTAIMSIMAPLIASGGNQFPEVDFRARVIPMVFAPGVATADEAATITLASGDERTGVVIRAARVPTYRVAGTITGPEAMPPNLTVQLTTPSQMNLPAGVNLGEAGRGGSGRFDFLAVPPGRYVLRAVALPRAAGGRGGRGGGRGGDVAPPAPTTPTWWATQQITIVDRDEVGLALALREGVRISGRLQFEGTTPSPPGERVSVMAADMAGASGFQTNTPSGASADGSFRTVGLPPGRYALGVANAPAPWRLKSVRAGGRDVTDVPLDVESDDISDVLIALTDQPLASLSGAVRRLRGDTDATAVVFIFPLDRDLWSHVGPTARRFRTARATDAGRYSLPGLPEGDYYVVAAHEDRLTDWLHPQVLESFAATAGRVQLRDGEQRTLDLTRNDR